jgi:hypothetical protein
MTGIGNGIIVEITADDDGIMAMAGHIPMDSLCL